MKKILLLLLCPFLLAFQCDEDDGSTGFETTYFIQNDSNSDLYYLNEQNSFIEIESQSSVVLGSTLNSETIAVNPSESFLFSRIKLYKIENDDFLLTYTQEPLNDDEWALTEPSLNRYEFRLLITDDLLD